MTGDLLICAATAFECAGLLPHAKVLVTGVGCVNAAYALTRYLDRNDVRGIVVCGIGGAYRVSAGLGIGEVACAESECYGDLGVETPEGFLDMEAIGFPVSRPLTMSLFPHARRAKFVTVNTCSGTDAAERILQSRTGGIIENMEGAAFAHVAALAGIPCGEIRGVSNYTGNRDRASWRAKSAAEAAQEALIQWIQTL